MKKVFRVSLSFEPVAYDLVTSVLYDSSIESFVEGSDSLPAPIEDETRLITFYAEDPETGKQVANAIREALGKFPEYGSLEVEIAPLANDNWETAWQEQWQAIEISERLCIAPTWVDYEAKPGQHLVLLDTTHAFGTGTHETTRLCLHTIDEHCTDKPGLSFLDVGCGTGILSIAAAKYSCRPIVGVDIEEDAVATAKSNAALNGLTEISFSSQPLQAIEGQFNIVCANILSSVLKELWPALNTKVSAGGKLVLSGVLTEEADEFINELELSNCEVRNQGGWAAILVDY